jgi:hypothetical protein
MLTLPNVTIVVVDCFNYNSAAKALLHSISKINFGKALYLSDKIYKTREFDCKIIEKIKSREEYSKFMITKLGSYIKTEFCLVIQYDGFIIHPELWTDEFLDYDYIGSPWWYEDGYNVGNGGFSLRSKNLLNACRCFIGESKEFHPEDDFIGRQARHIFEQDFDIKFAPEDIAEKFSWERNDKYPAFKNNTFGFHGIRNFIFR